ncbi:MAG: SRPBCC domain-containing protein [Candidatus Zixiibacteriota bacterium]
MPGFKAEVGYEFSFLAGDDTTKWLHLCKVTAVKPKKSISYTWRYDGYDGDSLVTFELFAEGGKTRLLLTHTGLDTFTADVAAFKQENFQVGWTEIIKKTLAKFLEGSK